MLEGVSVGLGVELGLAVPLCVDSAGPHGPGAATGVLGPTADAFTFRQTFPAQSLSL